MKTAADLRDPYAWMFTRRGIAYLETSRRRMAPTHAIAAKAEARMWIALARQHRAAGNPEGVALCLDIAADKRRHAGGLR